MFELRRQPDDSWSVVYGESVISDGLSAAAAINMVIDMNISLFKWGVPHDDPPAPNGEF